MSPHGNSAPVPDAMADVERRLAAQPLVQLSDRGAARRLGAVQTLQPQSRLDIERPPRRGQSKRERSRPGPEGAVVARRLGGVAPGAVARAGPTERSRPSDGWKMSSAGAAASAHLARPVTASVAADRGLAARRVTAGRFRSSWHNPRHDRTDRVWRVAVRPILAHAQSASNATMLDLLERRVGFSPSARHSTSGGSTLGESLAEIFVLVPSNPGEGALASPGGRLTDLTAPRAMPARQDGRPGSRPPGHSGGRHADRGAASRAESSWRRSRRASSRSCASTTAAAR